LVDMDSPSLSTSIGRALRELICYTPEVDKDKDLYSSTGEKINVHHSKMISLVKIERGTKMAEND
jgi:hypothetical protein